MKRLTKEQVTAPEVIARAVQAVIAVGRDDTHIPVSENTRCKHCGHARYAHVAPGDRWAGDDSVPAGCGDCVACGCTKFEARAKRDASVQPQWLVTVGFSTSKGVRQGTVRVHAAGHAGAIVKAIRQVKREVLKPRQRTTGVVVNVVRIKGGS